MTAGQFGIDQLVMYLCEVVDLNNQLLNDQLFGVSDYHTMHNYALLAACK